MQLIHLPCHSNDDLQWKPVLESIRKEVPIVWEFGLGLNAPYFSLEDEMLFSSLKLSLSLFTKEIWPSYQEQTLHAILYRGSADFSSWFHWTSLQEENWKNWKKERPTAKEEHLRRLFCRDTFLHYFQMLSYSLPDELPLELCLDPSGCGTKAETLQLLSQESFEHFLLERKEKEVSFAICLPLEMGCNAKVLSRLDGLFETIKTPWRIIEEARLTESWEGLDQIYVLSETISAPGKRKLMGFCAAGGTVIVEGDPLGLPREMGAEEFRGRGI